MAISISGPTMVDQLSSSNDKVALFQQANFADHVLTNTLAANGAAAGTNTGGDVFVYQPNILDADVAITGTKIPIGYKTGNAAMTKMALSSANISNGIQVLSSSGFGIEWLYRNITQDRNPTATYRDGSATFPAAETIVASASLGTTTEEDHTVVPISAGTKYAVQPEVTLDASATVGPTQLFGRVTIEGTDVNGVEITEELRFTTAQLGVSRVRKTSQWFKTVTDVTSQHFGAGNLVVAVDDNSTLLTYTPQDLKLYDFLTLEYSYGGLIPFTYRDLIINDVNLDISRDSVNTYACGVLGGVGAVRQNIAGGDGPTTLPTGVQRADTDIFVGTQSYVEIAGVRLPVISATLNMSQGLINANYLDHNLYQTAKPKRNDKRSLQITCTLDATVQNDFNTFFFQDAIVEDVRFVAHNAAPGTFGKYDAKTSWIMPFAEISEAPSISSAGNAVIPQTVTFMAYNNEGNPEYTIESEQEKYDQRLYHYAA